MTYQEPSPWKKTILAAMTSYIDAGSIVAGAAGLSLWQAYLGMDGFQMGALAALSSNAGSAAVGALIGGRICDKYGRKFVYTYDLLIYIIGMLLIVFGVNYPMLLCGYIIVGLGVGADIVASWTLIAEEAPAKDRAKHCGSAQFAWALGVLLISAWINQYGLIGNRIVFAHLIVVAAWVWYQRLKMPESKDWKAAKEAEEKLIAEGKVKPVSYSEILTGINLKTVLFLCGVYTIWNLCASTWGFFMPYIYEHVGNLSNSMSQLMSVGSFVISFVGWMLVMFTIFAGVNNGSGQQAFYQLWCSELFPTKYRATAQGLTFFITRILAAVWGFCVPIIMTTLGFRYAAMMLCGFAFISWLVGVIGAPKTEGKTLKQIEIEPTVTKLNKICY